VLDGVQLPWNNEVVSILCCHPAQKFVKLNNDASFKATSVVTKKGGRGWETELTAGVTDLDTSLANVDGDDFTHFTGS
jgi:hypothetical protein